MAHDKAFAGDRIAKVMARAGVCSRRDAERWIAENVPVADCSASSARRDKTPPISLSAESAIATVEIPSFAFRIAT